MTTAANELVRPIHERMPVILAPEAEAVWLNPGSSPDGLAALMRPYAGEMTANEVSPAVNNARNDGPECLQRIINSIDMLT